MDPFRHCIRHWLPQYAFFFFGTSNRRDHRIHISQARCKIRRCGYQVNCNCKWLCVGGRSYKRDFVGAENIWSRRGKLLGLFWGYLRWLPCIRFDGRECARRQAAISRITLLRLTRIVFRNNIMRVHTTTKHFLIPCTMADRRKSHQAYTEVADDTC